MKKFEKKLNEIEIGKLIDSLNSSQNMRIQIAIFFATIYVMGIIGYFSESKAAFLFFSSFIPVFYGTADYFICRNLYGFYYRAQRILKEQNYQEEESIFEIITLSLVNHRKKADFIKEILGIKKEEERYKLINNLPLRRPSILGFWIPLILFLGQLIYSSRLVYCYGW